MLTATLEQIQTSPRKRTIYLCVILALLAVILGFKTFRFFEGGLWYGSQTADFAAFHIVAQRIWLGDLDLTYQFASFTKMQMAAAGGSVGVMPWTYPPQFDLLLAPFAFLPGWAAYFLFTAVTLAAYLMVLRVIAGHGFAAVLVVFFPAIAITIGIGQNGLLTGALIGLVCINADRRPVLSGVVLGMMVIKPHLAVAAGIYMLLTRRWPAVLTAAIVVTTSSLVCTLAFGPQIWIAWLGSIREAASYLEDGRYQLFRMISAYAALYNAGLPAAWAFWGQMAMAALALVTVALAIARGPSPRFALGIVAVASVMISPYAYDYDLPIVGIGLALLLPELASLASPRERSTLYALLLLANAYGLLQSARLSAESVHASSPGGIMTPAVGGFALMAVLAILLWVLLREAKPAAIRLHGEPA
ncbi:glycosyltransferase family 87 protein [Bradyrhizobium manausense]